MSTALPAARLRRRVNPRETEPRPVTVEEDGDGFVGHQRAVEALRFGVAIRQAGYHVFALGRAGVGIRAVLTRELGRIARGRPTPDDLLLAHDFDHPRQPVHLRVPAGTGPELAKEVADALQRLLASVPTALAGEAHRSATEAIARQGQQARHEIFIAFQDRARARGVMVRRVQDTLVLAPLVDGDPIDAEALAALPEEARRAASQALIDVQAEMARLAEEERQRGVEEAEAREALDREVVSGVVRPALAALRERWPQAEVGRWLAQVEALLCEQPRDAFEPEAEVDDAFQLNVLVTRPAGSGAPVRFEDEPAWPNLAGRVEHEAREGALVTHHGLVRAGALHHASGGFLVLDALRLLGHPGAWAGLKRALRTRELRVEAPVPPPGVLATTTLEPEPLPLDLEVVLVGEPHLYRMLAELDPEFDPLFGVAAEFDDELPWTAEAEDALGALLARLAERDGALSPTPAAIARLLEHAGRLAGRQDRLSLNVQALRRVLREADHLARGAGRTAIDASEVAAALDGRRFREGGLAERALEDLVDRTLHVDSEGAVVGQVNGLAVLSTGRVNFGRPSRLTARVRVGRGAVVDIERAVGLGGPLHHKGVRILTGYLAGRYRPDVPLSLYASVVFEQSYGPVDGDSASMAELIALLSALAGRPVRQGIAITGSVDQLGRAQAIGGVNEKIEGWFALCASRGLTGAHGVLIPATNERHLMLSEEVVAAVDAGRFHVWTMVDVDEALAVLIDGAEPEAVHRRVEERLVEFAEAAARFGGR